MHGHLAALALHALVRDLDRITHVVSATLRHEGNAAGAEDVLAWQTGYPAAVSLAGGHPRTSPGELGAAAVLARGDADAALVVGSDPLEHLPAAAAERLRAIPVVSVDARDTATAGAARVAFTTAAARRAPARRRAPPRRRARSRCAPCSRPSGRATRRSSQAIAERIARAGEGAA